MRTITLVCATCGKPFDKEIKEYNRRLRLGKASMFCDEKCAGADRALSFDPFKSILLFARKNARSRPKECSITKEYLESIWQIQNGKCAYTDVELVLPHPNKRAQPNTASLDRIDSSKGYIKGNVEFVCVFVNLGKNGFSKQQVIDLLKQFKIGM